MERKTHADDARGASVGTGARTGKLTYVRPAIVATETAFEPQSLVACGKPAPPEPLNCGINGKAS